MLKVCCILLVLTEPNNKDNPQQNLRGRHVTQKPTALRGPRPSDRCRPDLWPTHTVWSTRSWAGREPVDIKNNLNIRPVWTNRWFRRASADLCVQLVEQVRHGLSVDVSGGWRQRRVDVCVGVDPNDAQLADRRRVTVDGADGQTDGDKQRDDVTSRLLLTSLSLLIHSLQERKSNRVEKYKYSWKKNSSEKVVFLV